MHETQVREQGVGHVLEEERRGADEVESYSIRAVYFEGRSQCGSDGWTRRTQWSYGGKMERGGDFDMVDVTYIFIASNCSFLGMISSIWGVRSGYAVVSCARRERWTEDFTLDLDPGEILLMLARASRCMIKNGQRIVQHTLS